MGGAYVVTRPEYTTTTNKQSPTGWEMKRGTVYYSGSGEDAGQRYAARWEQNRTQAKVMSKTAAQEVATAYRGRMVKANTGEQMEYAAAYIRANYHGHESQAIADRMREEGQEARRRLFEIQQGIQNEIDLIRAM